MKCGMGNWIDIAEQYVKSKTASDCEEHYFTFYYKSKEHNLPDESDVIITGKREISFPGCEDTVQGGVTPPKFTNALLQKVKITVPIDQEQSIDADERVKKYKIQR